MGATAYYTGYTTVAGAPTLGMDTILLYFPPNIHDIEKNVVTWGRGDGGTGRGGGGSARSATD